MSYGDSGPGKTSDLMRALSMTNRTVYVGPPGAFKSGLGTWGVQARLDGRVLDVQTVAQVTEFLKPFEAVPIDQRPDVIIDDLTILGEGTANTLLPYFTDAHGKFRGDDSFRYWAAIKAQFYDLKWWARKLGIHIAASAHFHKPDDKGKGGPRMPAREVMDGMPHIADVVLRVGWDEKRLIHRAIYHCTNGHPMFHEKDRHNVFRGTSPFNLGEGLRAAGYLLPRAIDPWGEDWVEAITAKLESGGSKLDDLKLQMDVFKAFEKVLLSQNMDRRHVLWILEDARDRWEFRKLHTSVLAA